MVFTIKKPLAHFANIARKIGYQLPRQAGSELNLIRPIGGLAYPRFHLYVKENPDNFVFNLHLDQKRPVYEGQTAHSGEYDSDLVGAEKLRIQKVLEED